MLSSPAQHPHIFPLFGQVVPGNFSSRRNSRGFGRIPEQGKLPTAKLFHKRQRQRWDPAGNGGGTGGEGGKAAECVEKHQVWSGTAFPRLNKKAWDCKIASEAPARDFLW